MAFLVSCIFLMAFITCASADTPETICNSATNICRNDNPAIGGVYPFPDIYTAADEASIPTGIIVGGTEPDNGAGGFQALIDSIQRLKAEEALQKPNQL
jgi:hypothetical protein